MIRVSLLSHNNGESNFTEIMSIKDAVDFGCVSPLAHKEVYLVYRQATNPQTFVIQPINKMEGTVALVHRKYDSKLPVKSFVARVHNGSAFYLTTETTTAHYSEHLLQMLSTGVSLRSNQDYLKMPGYETLSMHGTSRHLVVGARSTKGNQHSPVAYFFYDRKASTKAVEPFWMLASESAGPCTLTDHEG